MCRTNNKRLIMTAAFGVTEGPNKPQRPRREWVDDMNCGHQLWEQHLTPEGCSKRDYQKRPLYNLYACTKNTQNEIDSCLEEVTNFL